VDLTVRLRAGHGTRPQLALNNDLIEQLALSVRRLHAQFPSMTIDFIELLRYPGVVEDSGIDQQGLQAEALSLLDETLAEFVAAREREGGNLAAAMHERLDGIERIAAQVKEWLPEIRAALRARPGRQARRPEAAAGTGATGAGDRAQPAENRCRRGTRPPGQPRVRGAPGAVPAGSGGAPARLPDAGIQPRSQYAWARSRWTRAPRRRRWN
jgi:hypothetical protein